MRLIDDPDFYHKRVRPISYWDTFGNWFSKALGDIYNDQTMLQNCYATCRSHPYDETEFASVIKDYVLDFDSITKPSSPFIVYGPPGIGKTTYISHLLNIKIPKDYNLKIFPLFFDFRSNADFSKISDEFYKKIKEDFFQIDEINIFKGKSINEKVILNIKIFKELLNQDVIDFDINNIDQIINDSKRLDRIVTIIQDRYLSDISLTLAKMIKYIRKLIDVRIVFILDNFDHLENHNKIHQMVYSLSREIISKFGCPVFLPMRNYTFKDSYNLYGFVEADKPRNKSLSAPIHKSVLKKRKDYILSTLEERVELNEITSISSENLIEPITQVFNGIYQNKKIIDYIVGVSGSNIRTFLDIIALALQSGHLRYAKTDNNNTILTYESFIRASIYCNNVIYRPNDRRCPIINLFDNRESIGSRNTLVRIRILQRLKYISSHEKAEHLSENLRNLGYREENILQALPVLLKAGLIEEVPYLKSSIKISPDRRFKISSVGSFYIEKLLYDFNYFEAMAPSLNLPPSYKQNMLHILDYEKKSKREREIRHNSLDRIISLIAQYESEEYKIISESNCIPTEQYTIINPFLKDCLMRTFPEIRPNVQYHGL